MSHEVIRRHLGMNIDMLPSFQKEMTTIRINMTCNSFWYSALSATQQTKELSSVKFKLLCHRCDDQARYSKSDMVLRLHIGSQGTGGLFYLGSTDNIEHATLNGHPRLSWNRCYHQHRKLKLVRYSTTARKLPSYERQWKKWGGSNQSHQYKPTKFNSMWNSQQQH